MILLLSAALIWGLSFVAQSESTKYIGTFTFNALRTLLGAVSLLPIMFINKLSAQKKGVYKKETPEERRVLIKGGVLCGICLFAGCNLQQYA
ncbi:MAG: DMT family transporter, partial [Clostridiales bacterium]|nr:DMT family transporter [Clostridiales bacterium]